MIAIKLSASWLHFIEKKILKNIQKSQGPIIQLSEGSWDMEAKELRTELKVGYLKENSERRETWCSSKRMHCV